MAAPTKTARHEKFIQKEKLIEIIKRNPGRYSVAQLQDQVRLSNPTLRRTIEAEGLVGSVQWERPARKKNVNKSKMTKQGFLTDDMLKNMYVFS